MFVAIHWMVFSCGVLIAQPRFLEGLAFTGVLLGTFGASLIFWETRLSPDEAKRVTQRIINAGQQTELNRSDWRSVLILSLISLVILVLLIALILFQYERLHNGYRMIVQLEVALLYAIMPPVLSFLAIKGIRNWFHRNASYLKSSSQRNQVRFVKRYLQFLGFLSLLLAGILQIPATLFNHQIETQKVNMEKPV